MTGLAVQQSISGIEILIISLYGSIFSAKSIFGVLSLRAISTLTRSLKTTPAHRSRTRRRLPRS
jgi:hypothetical protein